MANLRLGDEAPNFEAVSTIGKLNFHRWLGESWGILFSHPSDFTPICTTELGRVAKSIQEFEIRNVKVAALSMDTLEEHQQWIQDINSVELTKVTFPLFADPKGKIAHLYGMIHPNELRTMTVRSLFIIDPQKVIRLIISYPESTGRNINEIIRVIDSLQLHDSYQVGTPANWENGDDCLIMSSVSKEQAPKLFPKGIKTILPYYRITPQPDLD